MNTMTSLVNKAVKDGYVDSFKVTERGLFSCGKDTYYPPEDVRVVNYYRFEGQSDPGDNSIMYQIETADGQKGTLIDAYGPYSDEKVTAFMDHVEKLGKKNTQGEKGPGHGA